MLLRKIFFLSVLCAAPLSTTGAMYPYQQQYEQYRDRYEQQYKDPYQQQRQKYKEYRNPYQQQYQKYKNPYQEQRQKYGNHFPLDSLIETNSELVERARELSKIEQSIEKKIRALLQRNQEQIFQQREKNQHYIKKEIEQIKEKKDTYLSNIKKQQQEIDEIYQQKNALIEKELRSIQQWEDVTLQEIEKKFRINQQILHETEQKILHEAQDIQKTLRQQEGVDYEKTKIAIELELNKRLQTLNDQMNKLYMERRRPSGQYHSYKNPRLLKVFDGDFLRGS
jgi:chromosome segregation protein